MGDKIAGGVGDFRRGGGSRRFSPPVRLLSWELRNDLERGSRRLGGDPHGRLLYNTSIGGPGDQVSHVWLNVTGNFVIQRRDSSILWESFRHPTDTILPTQSIVFRVEEGTHRLLVYEYMSNGTLADFLFRDLRANWSQRTQIAMGIAKGLTYLHEECSNQIIHCDIKPHNILLDDYYIARISDFGLAKLLTMNQSKTLTNIRSTKGYVALEWFRNTQISVKVDVYSFGVVLLEIISCRKIVEEGLEFGDGENPILTDWAWDCFVGGRLDALVRNEEDTLREMEMVERFVMVGL
ncbi:hypothetical protein SASPL_137813 [Salvia splendens]|uniref:Protein kinase domain-containing protein n=1 Tax=Salvia splendens TaxID=180675 RepID=A0A8X8WVN6_SALSN|nr:hypothetical protein SASPL_137813 [Salvia splendens]